MAAKKSKFGSDKKNKKMSQKPHKILVVDDEPDITELLSYNLKKEGFIVYTSPDGRDAIEQARKVKPDLILLDVMMPEMDGIETCQELRQIETLKDGQKFKVHDFKDSFVEAFRGVYHKILNPDFEGYFADFNDGFHTMQIVDAIYQSNMKKAWVKVND